ncbi:kinesin-like protein KIN-14L [Malania oleifera]|uniref:kinesin-like protein KIN-14L n=1 Tax=Malania oleifera TaxID=397392 RepID=UPI0025ADEAC2|nr:kinesin-like protein KIN-14L [Malania oleifera]
MEDSTGRGLHELNLASRKAEEAAWRRYQAAAWLESLVGPLGLPTRPSERGFISCLRNGLVLCNAVNKIQPGAVPKVVEIHLPLQSLTWDSQPLPAYQYFENVRNFLVAVEELKLPAFEASDLERDNLEAGSVVKVVDCILALKSYHECKQVSGGSGLAKHAKSPMVLFSSSRTHSCAQAATSSDPCRRLDMLSCETQPLGENGTQEFEGLVGSIAKILADCLVGAKENIDNNLLASYHSGNQDVIKLLRRVVSSLLEEQLLNKFPEVKSVLNDLLIEGSSTPTHSKSAPLEEISSLKKSECCRLCLKGVCRHWRLFQAQERNLLDLKALLSRTKMEFEDLQLQFQSDLKLLGTNVHKLSTAALGYQKVLKENRTLYNMVMDLKGNIRVYCRIRPSFSTEPKNVINFIGEDGTLVMADTSRTQKDGKKVFQFNRVFGPSATQDEVFKDTQPLIRSVMDGYNVCILAYGQTGSGKTHTMSGPSGGLIKDMGINYLALNDLFAMSSRRKGVINYEIHVQMVEIYNEQVRDLLAEDSSATKLEIRSCADNGFNLPDATMRTVKSTTDVLNLMKLGEMNRMVSSTAINNRSSRSHSVLTVHVHGKDESGGILRSSLHLVDLAGSERVDKSEVTGDRLKEAQCINKSLSCLGDVITALAQKSSHIPYRNSKLTLLLQDSLGGNAKTLMFAHVSPEADSFGETVSTLKFAQRVSTVELGAARLNKETSEVMQLKEQIESLKKALAKKEERNVQLTKSKEPSERPESRTQRTPLRPRRLSIENSTIMYTEQAVNFEEKKGSKSPSMPNRARRLSLEGQKHGKKENMQGVRRPLPFELVSTQQDQLQDVQSISKTYFRNGNSTMEVRYQKTPQSPNSIVYQGQEVKTQSIMKTKPRQPLKTPEKPLRARNEVQSLVQSEITCSMDSLTPSSNPSGKKSQIKKSLRTIGKLINGSEKRNQRHRAEAGPPSTGNGTSNINELGSAATANSRALRRQSLGGVQTARRSSLGGNSTAFLVNEARNAKTPPPVRNSTKVAKQWL